MHFKWVFFSPNNNIEYVNFEENQINTIDDGAFDDLKWFKNLVLAKNKIKMITSNMKKGLTSLEKLYLSGNRILFIEKMHLN